MTDLTITPIPDAPIPDPLLIKSEVYTCAGCGAWWCRVPAWHHGEGIGEQCEKCSCTSVKYRSGRPYGPRSVEWPWLIKQWREFVEGGLLSPDDSGREDLLESVVMPPDFVQEIPDNNFL